MVQTMLDMFRKTPEEVVRERHTPGFVEPELSEKEKKKKQHAKLTKLWAKVFQENGMPLSVINNGSFELMIDAIAQYGPGFVPPSQEELRGPLFEKQMKWMAELREKHEKAWERHGCTLMVDS